MSTPVKILVFLAIAYVGVHFFPFTLFPFSVLGLILGLMGMGLGLGIAMVATVGGALLLGVLGVAAGLLTALAPLWIPALIVFGIISLVRGGTRTPKAPLASV